MKYLLSLLAVFAFSSQSFAQDGLLPSKIVVSPSFPSPIEQLIRQLKGTTDDAKREKLTAQLKFVLERDYDEKMQVYEDHLQELEAQLIEMRQQLDRRRKAKDEMVNLRIQTIQAEADNLGWPTGNIAPSSGYGASSSYRSGENESRGMTGMSGSGSNSGYPGGSTALQTWEESKNKLSAAAAELVNKRNEEKLAEEAYPKGIISKQELIAKQQAAEVQFRKVLEAENAVEEAYRVLGSKMTNGGSGMSAGSFGMPTGENGGSGLSSYGNKDYGGMPGSRGISGSGSGGDYPSHDIQKHEKIRLKNILLAMHSYLTSNQKLPFSNSSTDDLGWAVKLLPYLTEIELFKQFDVDQPWHSKTNRSIAEIRPDVFGGESDYSFCWVSSEAKSFADITDGTSRTIAIVVIPNRLLAEPMTWTEPGGLSVEQIQTMVQGLNDDEEFIVGTYDGSVYQLPSKAVKGTLFKGYLTINGGESMALPFPPTSSPAN